MPHPVSVVCRLLRSAPPRRGLPVLLAGAALALAPAAAARTIVLSNDDGLTSNIVALYRALKAAGHDVVVSVPCTNQSGMGAAAWLGRPLPPLTAACRADAAQAGDPAAGPMTRADLPAGDFHYVAGTPVMATRYGIDVVARKRWGKAPDLVLSGPNEGQNVGSVILGSGTVSNARAAAALGIPAIALSAGPPSFGDDRAARPESEVVARRAVELVTALDKAAPGAPVLPRWVALNVNFPDAATGARWQLTRLGTYEAYRIAFVENMARDATPGVRALMAAQGASLQPLPGIALELSAEPPRPDQRNDEAYVYRTAIAVSPIDDSQPATPRPLGWLRSLVARLNAQPAHR